MASLLEKANTLIKANLHEMVDKALEANSVAVMKQYIRDAEKNLDDLEDATATVGGEVKTLERKYKEYKKKADQLDRNIDALLMQGKADLARAAQNELNTNRELQERYHEQWVRQEREYDSLKNARLKLEAKIKDIRLQQREMESLLKLAKSKEVTNKAIKSLDDLNGVGDGDIARLRDSIQGRLDKASARGELYADRLDNQLDDALGAAEIDLQLEERKRRLGLGKPPEPSFDDDSLESSSSS